MILVYILAIWGGLVTLAFIVLAVAVVVVGRLPEEHDSRCDSCRTAREQAVLKQAMKG